jgi:hypothetical protein
MLRNGFCSATSLPGSAVFPFVISTEAKRSGETSVLIPFLEIACRNCRQQLREQA